MFDLTEILPLHKSYEGVIIQPLFQESIIKNNNNGNVEDQSNNSIKSDADDDINSFLDNDDVDFVIRNIDSGKEAERYVQELMLCRYGNCTKVKASEGYDFKVLIEDKEIKIEVKSIQSYNSPFHITINEIDHAIYYSDEYYICFVVLPSLVKGVQDVRFLCNPIRELGIEVRDRKYEGLENKCIIMPEKFLIKPTVGHIKKLSSDLK